MSTARLTQTLRYGRLALAVLAITRLLPAGLAQAAQLQNATLTLSPSSQQVALDAGATKSLSLSLRSDGTAYPVRVYSSAYRVTGEAYDPSFTPLPGTVDPSGWVHVPQQAVIVPAAIPLTVPFSLTVPPGTAPGGYYAVLFAESAADASDSGNLRRVVRVGEVLYITVNGPITRSGVARSFSVPRLELADSLPLSVDVANTGGVHFQATVMVSGADLFGRERFHASLADRYVLPQTVRRIGASWDGLPLLGVYRLSATATLPTGVVALPSQWVLVIRPWLVVVLGVLVLLLMGTGVERFLLRRRR